MKTTTSVKLDPKIREDAQRLSEELGLTLSTVINALLGQFTRSRELNLSSLPTMSDYLEAVIAETDADFASGKLKTYDSLDDLIKAL